MHLTSRVGNSFRGIDFVDDCLCFEIFNSWCAMNGVFSSAYLLAVLSLSDCITCKSMASQVRALGCWSKNVGVHSQAFIVSHVAFGKAHRQILNIIDFKGNRCVRSIGGKIHGFITKRK